MYAIARSYPENFEGPQGLAVEGHGVLLEGRSFRAGVSCASILLQIAGLPMARADHRRFAGVPP